ncbi:MAG: cold shock domain-containing protein [Acidobacteria bacterium]|nr:cold shock domain-containing protein [Acidobacteriota bacterium]
MTGAITTINVGRGFGFIRGDDEVDYFFHRAELREGLQFEELKQGQFVRFDTHATKRGPRATEVTGA